jgi:predicted transcriptional regulator
MAEEPPKRHQRATSFRLSPEALTLLVRLAEALGISQAGVIEMAVRQLARRELPAAEAPSAPKKAGKRRGE